MAEPPQACKKQCKIQIRLALGCVPCRHGASEVDFDRKNHAFVACGGSLAQDGPKKAQDGPKRPKDGIKMAPRGPKMVPRGLKIVPR